MASPKLVEESATQVRSLVISIDGEVKDGSAKDLLFQVAEKSYTDQFSSIFSSSALASTTEPIFFSGFFLFSSYSCLLRIISIQA